MRHNDCLKFSLSQTKKFLDILNEFLELQRANTYSWFLCRNFTNGHKYWFIKYIIFGCLFGIFRVKTGTFYIDDINVKFYKFKIHNIIKAEKLRNILSKSVKEKNPLIKVKCRNCEEIIDDYDEDLYPI